LIQWRRLPGSRGFARKLDAQLWLSGREDPSPRVLAGVEGDIGEQVAGALTDVRFRGEAVHVREQLIDPDEPQVAIDEGEPKRSAREDRVQQRKVATAVHGHEASLG
jgi:hypothetical protein